MGEDEWKQVCPEIVPYYLRLHSVILCENDVSLS
jgi:hypothetical protein